MKAGGENSVETEPTLWLRLPEQRSIVAAHLRHVRGRFRSAGWRIVEGPEVPAVVDGALAVVDDPWVEPLPELAWALAQAKAKAGHWRLPRVNGLASPQGWETPKGPYTARDYERVAVNVGNAAEAIVGGREAWLGFAVAAQGEAAGLLSAGWPPAPSTTIIVPQARLYRYADPAGHERTEVDPLIPETARTLVDVGCGHGLLGARHRRKGRKVVGIEPDPELAFAASRRLDLVLPVGAEEGLAALAPGLDCIVFADVLEHLVDPPAALEAAARVLAHDGRIIVSLPNSAWAPVLHGLACGRWDPAVAGVQARDHFANFTPLSFQRLAAECGLRVIREVPLFAPLPRRLRLWAWVVARLSGGDLKHLLTPQWISILVKD